MNKRAISIIDNMIIARLTKIRVESGFCRYNYKCQMNSVHDAIINNEDRIAMCLCSNGGCPYIHFININSSGVYIDNTLGVWSRDVEYYLVRIIVKDEFFDINDIFSAYRNELRRMLPWYVRLFSDEMF